MATKQLYRQCKMVKGNVNQVAWIPTQFAKVGKSLSFKQEDDSWDQGWKVVEAYDSKRTIEEMDSQRDAQKRWESVLK